MQRLKHSTRKACSIRYELSDQRGIAISLVNLGFVAHHQGDYQQAATFFEKSLSLFQKMGSWRGVVDCFLGLAGAAASARQPERAARLFGATEHCAKPSMLAQCCHILIVSSMTFT